MSCQCGAAAASASDTKNDQSLAAPPPRPPEGWVSSNRNMTVLVGPYVSAAGSWDPISNPNATGGVFYFVMRDKDGQA